MISGNINRWSLGFSIYFPGVFFDEIFLPIWFLCIVYKSFRLTSGKFLSFLYKEIKSCCACIFSHLMSHSYISNCTWLYFHYLMLATSISMIRNGNNLQWRKLLHKNIDIGFAFLKVDFSKEYGLWDFDLVQE